MKNLTPRQTKIVELVEKQGNISVEVITRTMSISQATAYREIQWLVQNGLVAKIPGGIQRSENTVNKCIQCGGDVNTRVAFIFERKNNSQLSACCPHCGFMALASRTDIVTALAMDFLNGKKLNVRQATYVVNSDISLCCHPSVLSFSNRKDAERFAKGFGGTVMDFEVAQKKILKLMEF